MFLFLENQGLLASLLVVEEENYNECAYASAGQVD